MTDAETPAHHAASGGFRNPWPDSEQHGLGGMLRWTWERWRAGRLGRSPRAPVAAATPQVVYPRVSYDECRVTWVGHSSFLLQIDGLNVLTDPVWGERASPVGWAGPSRLNPPGISLDQLPPIDLVLLSHDHYDHLCDSTVREVAHRFPLAVWCAALGVGTPLGRRGVQGVGELAWFGSAGVAGAHVTCVPARHFSGRTITGRNSTLWCGWALIAGRHRLYFVGDTGSHPDFASIAARCGPFDVVLMPIGAYDPRWFMRPVHLDPEEAVEAYRAIAQAQRQPKPVMVGMHWGTFSLTDEPAHEPPVRTRAAWAAHAFDPELLWILAPGETRALNW